MDLVLSLFLFGLFSLRNKSRKILKLKSYVLGTLGLLGFLWIELVLLLPFQKWKVPGISSDPNIRIRKEYWVAGLNQLGKALGFGVGPDNYGNFYQQTRTVMSVRVEENIISNDAHSSLFQTLATLGVFGTLAFILLWTLLGWALYFNFKQYREQRKLLYFLGAYFLVYLTNSLVSPITLPNKFIFWSIAGLNFGIAGKDFLKNFREKINLEWEALEIALRRIFLVATSLLATLSIFIIGIFTFDQFKLIGAINGLDKKIFPKTVTHYKPSNNLPCTYYYNAQAAIASRVSTEKLVAFSENYLKSHPRCVEARINLAKIYLNRGENGLLALQVGPMMDMAPANRDVLEIVGTLANRINAVDLQKKLYQQGVKLGFIKPTK